MTNATDKMTMQVNEDQDGSALVTIEGEEDDLDNNLTPDNQEDSQPAKNENEGNEGQQSEENDEDRQQLRETRREERRLKKALHKNKEKEANQLINHLRQQNQELASRVATLETRTAGADMARLDKAIDDAKLRENYTKMKYQEAITNKDGATAAQMQEAWYESRRQREELESIKKKLTTNNGQPPQQNSGATKVDPRLQSKANAWLEKHDWYDPSGRNLDSRITLAVDEELTAEGWDPKEDDYWEELDNRLRRHLPHRFQGSGGGDDGSGHRQTRRGPPVSGSGRESSGGAGNPREFRLSPERVAAIKAANCWEDKDKRNAMIRRYREYDRQHQKS